MKNPSTPSKKPSNRKLTINRASVRDLTLSPGQAKEIKGGVATYRCLTVPTATNHNETLVCGKTPRARLPRRASARFVR